MAEITGRKVLIFTVGAFGIIIAVNVLMAYKAVSTFPGLEVSNSYVASQTFESDLKAQQSLGWALRHGYDAANGLELAFTDAQGAPVEVADLSVLLGRSTVASADQQPQFVREAGVYRAALRLDPGKWVLHVTAHAADGRMFRQRLDLMVRG